MITCQKIYKNIPFAHRQPNHSGGCALLHGHTWSIKLNLGAHTLDANKFVMDFGDMHFIEEWIDAHLDHACVLRPDDPLRAALESVQPSACKFYFVENCSCEGLAMHLGLLFDRLLKKHTDNRVFLVDIEVSEDDCNSACYRLLS